LASPRALLISFLEARSKWMSGEEFEDENDEVSPARLLSRHQRTLSRCLKTVSLTMRHLEDIFKPQGGETLMQPVFQTLSRFKVDLEALTSSGEFERIVSGWFQEEASKVCAIRACI